jgi:invasion protein IalB
MITPRIPVAVLAAFAASIAVMTAAQAQAPRPPDRPLPAPAAAQPAAALPGGATSLQETHGDWVVGCVVQGAAKRCGVTQEQTNQQTRQRVVAMELTPAGDRIEGVLLLPFGLVLDQGVALQIDDQAQGQTLRFRTCLPGGCLVPLGFDARQTAALRAGTALKARVMPDGGQPTVLTISLKGLGSALDRTAALAR